MFDDKTSVLLNFRKLKHDQGETSEVFKEITNVVSSALIPTLESVSKDLETIQSGKVTFSSKSTVSSI